MIEMGLLLGKMIPMDVLMRLPRPFVHRLRDVRIKQLEDANREREQQQREQQLRSGDIRNLQAGAQAQQMPSLPAWDPGMQTGTEIDDLMDELNPF